MRTMTRLIKDKLLVFSLFLILSVLSVTTIYTLRISTETKRISQQNQTFLGNFSDYMRCLVVVDEPKYAELGKEKYFDTCDLLLFRGTGMKPHTHTSVPTTSTTKGTTTSGSNTIGG